MGVSGQLHALAVLLTVPIGYEAVWAPEPVWTQWRANVHCPCQESNPDRPLRSIVTILTVGVKEGSNQLEADL
jgi:hypothetical protein